MTDPTAPDGRAAETAPAGPRRRPASTAARERDTLRALLDSIGREAELGPLLARVLELACTRLGADCGAVGLLTDNGSAVRVAAEHRLPMSFLGRELPAGVGSMGEVLRRRAPVRLRRYGDVPTPVVPGLDDHAVLVVPLWDGDALLGMVALYRAPARRPGRARLVARSFRARDAVTLGAFAGDAGVAVANVRRYDQERRRADRLALIAHVGRLVTADLHLDDLLQRAADATHELLGYENVAVALLTRDGPGGAPAVLDLRHFGGAYKRAIGGAHRIPVGVGLMGAAARTGEVVLVDDAAADPRYLPTPGTDGRHAELAIPLLLGGEVLGVLNVERRAPFGAEDVAHLRVVADQLAVAVENARLHGAARQAAVLEERHRLARELHDSVTQQLFTAAMVAQGVGTAYARDPAEGARRADMLVALTRGALAEMRALLAELRPAAPGASGSPPPPDAGLAALRGGGLAAALRAHLAVHVEASQAAARDAAGRDSADPPLRATLDAAGYAPQAAAVEEALYRVAREALHNVVKHARAARVAVRLAAGPDVVRLTVADDGVGFAPRAAPAAARRARPGGGLGLGSMAERAAEAGGALRVTSAPGRGTTVEVTLPAVPNAAAPNASAPNASAPNASAPNASAPDAPAPGAPAPGAPRAPAAPLALQEAP